MREGDFKLSDDDTIRRLRSIAQAPGELQWRLELVSTLERMRLTQELATRSLIQSQTRLRESLAHLTPGKLEATIDKRIDSRRREQDSERYRRGLRTFVHHLITAAVSITVAYIIWRLTGAR